MDKRGADSACAAAAPQGPAAPSDRITVLIGRYYAEVYRQAYRLSGNAADAEDLTQQTFLAAHERLHQLGDMQKAGGWLSAILRNGYLKSRRRERPVAAANLDLDVDNIPDEAAEADIDGPRLQLALNELADEFKIVLVMFYFEECSYKEIAEKLGLSLGTVMSRLSRAKVHLRKRLAGHGKVEVR
jgi:RNA polymerase sigma-70 factor, ECF subfamily